MVYTDINDIQGEYGLILSDPPWQIKKAKRKSRPNSSMSPIDYPTMDLNDIKDHLLKITEHSSSNAIMFLWTIESQLYNALSILNELGWKKHVVMIWSKGRGMAPAFSVRFTHEYLIYAYRGKFERPIKEMQGKFGTVFTGISHKHSEKPQEVYEMIEAMYPSKKKIEMYARLARQGWDSFGNEVNAGGEENESKVESSSS